MLPSPFPLGSLSVGSGSDCDIVIKGIGILKHHVTLTNTDNEKVLLVENEGDVLVNGAQVDKDKVLNFNSPRRPRPQLGLFP